jgi:predicted O-methyltransferase YrrM
MASLADVAQKAGRFLQRYFYAAFGTLYAFTIGLPRNRLLIYDICAYFGWPAPDWLNKAPRLLPEAAVSDVVSGDVEIKIFEGRKSGNTSLLESIVINKLVKQASPRGIFEIGTFDGGTTLAMAANSGEAVQIFTLDLPKSELENTKFEVCGKEKQYIEKPESGARFKGTVYQRQITQLFGDSASFDYSPYHGTIDVVFIDGSHAYDYVKSDTENALKLLRNSRGLILWHDYGEWDGVTIALNEYHAKDRRFTGLKCVEGTTLALMRVEPA